LNLGDVRLVGMTHDELQSMYKFRRVTDPTINNGLETVFMLPDDVILNTRRAFSTSPTSLDGYGALGAPTGRYIAPANYDGCMELRSGDCGLRNVMLRTPWFVRMDVGLTKRLPLHGRSNIELAVQVINLLGNINFDPIANPGSGATVFQTSTIYM